VWNENSTEPEFNVMSPRVTEATKAFAESKTLSGEKRKGWDPERE
jgi:hypothetical protein